MTGMYELLDAIEAVIRAADPAKREALARTIDAYSEDFAEDFLWSIGASSPTLLSHLIMAIDIACRDDDAKTKSRLVDVKTIAGTLRMKPRDARAALRKAKMTKPSWGWAFEPAQVEEVKRIIVKHSKENGHVEKNQDDATQGNPCKHNPQ